MIRLTLHLCSALIALAVLGSFAQADWIDEKTSGLFTFRSEFVLSEKTTATLVREVALLQSDVLDTLSLEPTNLPIEVNLFSNRNTYRQYLLPRVPQGVNRTALFVQGTDMGRVYVYRHASYDVDVRHESTHAVLHNALPYVPIWLDEGLAEYFEVSASLRSKGNPHLGPLRRSTFFGWKPNLERLETNKDIADMSADDYREAWAWVHFMLHGPDAAQQVLKAHLQVIHNGDVAGPLHKRLFVAIPDANRALVHHLRAWK
jgi:hypothetical protein